MEPRIRDEIGAIAVLAFALLSTVALATDQGAVLQWWRSALFAFLGWAAWLVPLALGALLLVGLVIAANRTIAELWKPIWRQRPDMGGLKPGTLIPGGTATRFDRFGDVDDHEPEQMRIHIPEEKPGKAVAAQAPKPSL